MQRRHETLLNLISDISYTQKINCTRKDGLT